AALDALRDRQRDGVTGPALPVAPVVGPVPHRESGAVAPRDRDVAVVVRAAAEVVVPGRDHEIEADHLLALVLGLDVLHELVAAAVEADEGRARLVQPAVYDDRGRRGRRAALWVADDEGDLVDVPVVAVEAAAEVRRERDPGDVRDLEVRRDLQL